MLDRQAGVLAQPLDEVAAQPAALLARERRDDDLVDALVVDGLQRRGVRVGVHDLAVRVDALAAQLASARGAAGGRPPRARSSSLCGATIRKLAGALRRPLADRGRAARRDDGLVRDHEHVRLAAALGAASTTTCSTGMAAGERARSRSTTLRRIQPERSARVRRDDDLVDRRLELRERVLHRLHRAGLDDEALRGDAAVAQRLQRLARAAAAPTARRVSS